MLVPHSLEDGLVCAGFLTPGKGHILFTQPGEGGANLLIVCLGKYSHTE
jgi:hypothetical protein